VLTYPGQAAETLTQPAIDLPDHLIPANDHHTGPLQRGGQHSDAAAG
jgi:hypothetical protein